jgi:hypothetical protein
MMTKEKALEILNKAFEDCNCSDADDSGAAALAYATAISVVEQIETHSPDKYITWTDGPGMPK